MPRVSIRYQNGTTVDCNNLEDAMVHLVSTDVSYVVDVVEDVEPEVCKHCNGSGRMEPGDPPRVLTRKQVEDRIAAVNEKAPIADGDRDARVKAARSVAKG